MKRIRTGIIGCGKVGRLHATVLDSLPESDFVAVCDRNETRAERFGAEFDVAAYTSVEKILKDAWLEAVVVCTPHPIHAEPVCMAAQAGVHILVEKPMASSLADCDLMLQATSKSGVKLGIVSQRRFYEPVKRLKAAIEGGKIGKPILAIVTVLGWRDRTYYQSDTWRGTWRGEGGGVLVNQAAHQLDILLWLMGSVSEVVGYWANLNHPAIEVDDTAVAAVRFLNGALGSITVSNSQNPGLYAKVHVHGENGASVGVQTDGGSMFIAGVTEISEPPCNDLWTVPGEAELRAAWREHDRDHFSKINATTYYHYLQDQDFIRAILEDRPPLVNGMEGRQLVELFTAIYRSQEERRPILFPLSADAGSAHFDGRLSSTL